MESIIEYMNDFVIVKESFGNKQYLVTKEFSIDKDYPLYSFSNYKDAVNFIKAVTQWHSKIKTR